MVSPLTTPRKPKEESNMKEMNPLKQHGSLQAVQATVYDGYTQAVSRVQSMPKLALAGASIR